MKKPSCFQVTKNAIDGIARRLLTSQDGSGASGPSSWLTSPSLLNRNSQTADHGDARRHVRARSRPPAGRSGRGSTRFSAVASTSESTTVSGTLMTRKIADVAGTTAARPGR